MFAKLKLMYQVLEQGKNLADPAKWKNAQVLANGLMVIMATVGSMLPEAYRFEDTTMQNLAFLLGGVGSLANTYLTVATTNKIGLKPKGEGNDECSDL